MNQLSILVAGGTPDFCSPFSAWLRAHQTVSANSGDEAVALLHFDLVTTIIAPPDVAGFDLIRRVKQCQPSTRVLAISSENRSCSAGKDGDVAASISAAADSAILRPFDKEFLLRKVEACWNEGGYREQTVIFSRSEPFAKN